MSLILNPVISRVLKRFLTLKKTSFFQHVFKGRQYREPYFLNIFVFWLGIFSGEKASDLFAHQRTTLTNWMAVIFVFAQEISSIKICFHFASVVHTFLQNFFYWFHIHSCTEKTAWLIRSVPKPIFLFFLSRIRNFGCRSRIRGWDVHPVRSLQSWLASAKILCKLGDNPSTLALRVVVWRFSAFDHTMRSRARC